ncbi:unnamed protein product [Sphenostylis stenocarpa]|uniref:ABC transporter domain-containing protein n=1 Tax=Sphenostylis stenocarpa TaxID=92480 RepID=A0AA86SFR3_9FABA|nr:unnamed protein product [Sphenostylis stenocarpa]
MASALFRFLAAAGREMKNAMVNNEFLGDRWKHILPNSTEPLGVEVLKSRGFFIQSYWFWIGVAALIGYTLLFNLGYILALAYLSREEPGKQHAFIAEEPESNEQNGGRNKGTNLLRHIKYSFNPHSIKVRNGESMSGSTSSHTLPTSQRGMVLPFEPHSITFDEVTYAIDMPQEMRNRGVLENKLVLLKGVSGSFRPGVLTALMGVTGAGKTTLMDVLAGRKSGGYVGGNITISGYQKKQETFARISGYCEQNDIHSPHVTVYESLLYSAWLRLSPDINDQTRKMFIEEVMELVELKPLRYALVGFPGVNGLSIEQRKRLTIAVELVANPSIIFMDEPTSGLDARAAAIVMRTVRNTVDTGRTVVCTIHQPSIDIFESFDELLLLKQGGQAIYVGPLGRRSSNLISYFEGIQGVSKIRDGYNPATWMLEVTSSAKELELGIDFAEVYKNSELYSERQQDLFNAMGSMYTAVLLLGVKNSNSVQPVVAVERTVLIELPYILVQAVVYSIIVYAMIGFDWTVRIPVWWRWYSWANPISWSLYGLVASQYGDTKHSIESSLGRTTVEGFVRSYFGFEHDFLGVVAVVIVAFTVVFALIFAVSVKVFNFQRR